MVLSAVGDTEGEGSFPTSGSVQSRGRRREATVSPTRSTYGYLIICVSDSKCLCIPSKVPGAQVLYKCWLN